MTPHLHKLFTFLSVLDNVYECHNVHGNAKFCYVSDIFRFSDVLSLKLGNSVFFD